MVFTSGSTGTPQPHQKHWGTLVQSVQAEVERAGPVCSHALHPVVGTVPPQHMYGLESTVLLALHRRQRSVAAQPFYPADIVARRWRRYRRHACWYPRRYICVLLLDAELALPEIALVLSATAPLSPQLAQAIEARCNAPLLEIYGSTETGLIATRRSTQSARMAFASRDKTHVDEDDCVAACGGHIETPIVMNDMIEPITRPTIFYCTDAWPT